VAEFIRNGVDAFDVPGYGSAPITWANSSILRVIRRPAGKEFMKARVDLLALLALAVFAVSDVDAAEQGACDMRLAVELTPDVPDTREPGFLNSLLGDPSSVLAGYAIPTQES
jgi:hypothetical protein